MSVMKIGKCYRNANCTNNGHVVGVGFEKENKVKLIFCRGKVMSEQDGK